VTYLSACGICLARAHARTGEAAAISGYLGSGDVFEQAIRDFAVVYANQTINDHQSLLDVVRSGRIITETGISALSMNIHPSKTRSVIIAVLGFWLGAVLGNVGTYLIGICGLAGWL